MTKVLVLALMAGFFVNSTKLNVPTGRCVHENTRIRVTTEETTYSHAASVTYPNGMVLSVLCDVTREVDTAVKVCVSCGEELGIQGTASRESHSVAHD